MKRLTWAISLTILIVSAFTARQIYPANKWWMRAAYVKAFQCLDRLTGIEGATIPDRFK